jgi:hypothetical protein
MHSFLTGREAGGIKPVFGLTAFVSSFVQTAILPDFFFDHNPQEHSNRCSDYRLLASADV